MRTKKGGNFSRMLRTMTSRMPRMSRMSRMPIMPRMSIFPRMSRRSSRVLPTSMISKSASSRAESIEELQKTLETIETNITEKNEEYKRKLQEAKTAFRSGDKKVAIRHFRLAKSVKFQVESLKVNKAKLIKMQKALESVTDSVASTSRKGGKIMRKSKRRIRRIRKTRRHKI